MSDTYQVWMINEFNSRWRLLGFYQTAEEAKRALDDVIGLWNRKIVRVQEVTA